MFTISLPSTGDGRHSLTLEDSYVRQKESERSFEGSYESFCDT